MTTTLKTQQPTIYAYLRVSTEDQTIENSKLLIYEYLNKNNYNTSKLKFYCEKKSGYKFGYKDRKISDILKVIKENDILIVSSLSRISRKLIDVLHFVENEVSTKKFKLIIAKNNMILDNSPMNKLLISMLATCAEFEIDILRERTKAGIKRYKKENNGRWGRPKTNNAKRKLDPHKEEIIKMIKADMKKKNIATRFDVTPLTLRNFIKKNISC
jgi:putative DNA-invertase from lambdoid prophage Rac